MAVTRETLQLIGNIRIMIADTVDAITDDLVRSWAYSWSLIQRDWEDTVEELQNLRDDGKWPTRSQVIRAERAQRALEATYRGLQKLGEHAGISILAGVGGAVQAAMGQVDVIASQLPPNEVIVRSGLVRADTEQIRSIVIRTQEQVTKSLFPLPGDSYNQIRSTLIRGVALGQNPRAAARALVRGIEIGYNQSLTRALVITRTELLDAHRAAAHAHDQANAAVLSGWEWLCALDSRTCPSCWGMHGTLHELDEAGPIDHHQGRCSRLTRTKTWRELGIDMDEPPSLMPDAQATFKALPRDEQLQIMGAKRLAALDSGDVAWSDLSTLRHNPGWRDSRVVTPLRDLISSS